MIELEWILPRVHLAAWAPATVGALCAALVFLAARLKRVAAEMPESVAHEFGPRDSQLPACFEILLRYRESVEGVLTFISGVLEASGLYAFAYSKAGELNRIIWNHIAIVDDILVTLINPKGKRFTVDELTHDYSYPDVDLSEIDADWW